MEVYKMIIRGKLDKEENDTLKQFLGIAEKKKINLYFSGFKDVPHQLVKSVLFKRLKGLLNIRIYEKYGFATFEDEYFAKEAVKNTVKIHFKNQVYYVTFRYPDSDFENQKKNRNLKRKDDRRITDDGERKEEDDPSKRSDGRSKDEDPRQGGSKYKDSFKRPVTSDGENTSKNMDTTDSTGKTDPKRSDKTADLRLKLNKKRKS